jgi:glutaconate CoA-transferase subunit B
MMKPDAETKEFEVVSLHPGITRERVREQTSWAVRFAANLDETPPPDRAELDVLRELNARTAAAHANRRQMRRHIEDRA